MIALCLIYLNLYTVFYYITPLVHIIYINISAAKCMNSHTKRTKEETLYNCMAGTFLVGQWVRPCASNAEGMGSMGN